MVPLAVLFLNTVRTVSVLVAVPAKIVPAIPVSDSGSVPAPSSCIMCTLLPAWLKDQKR